MGVLFLLILGSYIVWLLYSNAKFKYYDKAVNRGEGAEESWKSRIERWIIIGGISLLPRMLRSYHVPETLAMVATALMVFPLVSIFGPGTRVEKLKEGAAGMMLYLNLVLALYIYPGWLGRLMPKYCANGLSALFFLLPLYFLLSPLRKLTSFAWWAIGCLGIFVLSSGLWWIVPAIYQRWEW